MIVSSKQCIGPVPVLEMRRCLRIFNGRSFNETDIYNHTKISLESARKALRTLRDEGYVADEKVAPDVTSSHRVRVVLTDKGRELSRSTAAKPVRRKTADRLLREFMSRVAEINGSDDYLISVARVAVFGSYLTDKDPIGDLDIAVETNKRWALNMPWDRLNALQLAHHKKSGRPAGNLEDASAWPLLLVNLLLKNRTRSIRIEPWESFIGIAKLPNFQYRVLLGDSEQIAQELSTAEAKATIRASPKTASSQR